MTGDHPIPAGGRANPHPRVYDLRPVDFSVLSLITHNPGITSRQPHPTDGRAMGLHLTAGGARLMRDAERTAAQLEAEVASRLTPSEGKTLIRLLKKVYI